MMAVALCACEAVPDITFANDDGGFEKGDSERADAGAADGNAYCPAEPPPGARTCCESVPCSGTCTTGECQTCARLCAAAGLVCCTAMKPVTCAPLGTACP